MIKEQTFSDIVWTTKQASLKMTFGKCARSFGDFKTSQRERSMNVTEALQRVVSRAIHDGRLVTGITEIAAVLKRFSRSSVMFCVVDIRSVEDIQMKLLEAFCTEHNIKLIKVGHCYNLFSNGYYCEITTPMTGTSDRESAHTFIDGEIDECTCGLTSDNFTDKIGEQTEEDESKVTCLLLTQPTHLSCEEEFVLSFYNTYRTFRKDEYPILRIPDSTETHQ